MPVTIDVPGLGPVSIPDNVPSEQADQYVRQVAQQRGVKLNLPAPAPAPVPEKSFSALSAARDFGVSALGLIPGVVETVAEFTPTDRALAAIGAQRGIAGLMPETEVGKDIGRYGVLRGAAKSMRDLQEELRSEQYKEANKELEKKLAEQEGIMGKAGVAFKETLTTPELLAGQLPESLLSMLGGRGLVKGAEKVIKGVAPEFVKEAGEKAVGKAAEKLGAERVAKLKEFTGGPETLRTVAGGAAMQGASVANQNFIATMDMPQNKLAATEEYQEAIASGMTPEEARLSVARGAANGALAPATALSVVAQYAVPGGTSFERLFAGATQRTLGAEGALQVAKQIGKSTLGEAGSEALEEGGGQFISNVFTPGQEDLGQGVGEAIGAAGALGALMGGGAGGVNALQANRARKVIEERQAAEEQARQELDARMPPVEQIQHPEPVQLAPEQVRNTAQELVSNIQPGSAFTLDDITSTTGGAIAGADAAAVANDLLNRGEIVREPGDTLSFRRVNDDERVIPLGNPDESYVYTVPTARAGSEINDGYTVESQALGVTRNVANQEEADQLKQLMLNRAGEQAAVVDEQINNLREQEQQVTRTIEEAMLRSDVTSEQLQGLRESGQQASKKIKQEIAKLEEQKATILAEPVVNPINPRAETGYQVRLHNPGEAARVLSEFANEQEAYDAIIDNASPEQERRIVEDPAYEGVRNRLEERAAQLEEEPEEAPVQMTPEVQQRLTEVSNRMRSVLDQMGLQNIGLNVQQRLQEVVNGKLTAIDGKYLNRIISASLEGYEDSRDITGTIGHETIHALRELGMFSDKEWAILTKKAKSEWVEKYEIKKRYAGVNLRDEKVIEEAIADAFGDWLQGNLQERGVIQGLFNRIKLFMERFGSVLRGQGFTTSSDIFKRARTGTLEGDRVARPSEGTQFALPKESRTELGLYSALADSIQNIQTNAAPAAGWKQAIQGLVNKGQVKKDEVEWSGIDDWLDLQQGKVTKQQVEQYLRDGGVRVEEVALGVPEMEQRWYVFDDAGMRIAGYDKENAAQVRAEKESLESNSKFFVREELVKSYKNPTKYGSYTLPGGENYREVLLTLPKSKRLAEAKQKFNDLYRAKQAEAKRLGIHPNNIGFFQGDEAYRAEHDRLMQIIRTEESNQYKSGHWNQGNILAHIRVNDRTDAEGNKVLFVEELQSDWAQQGSKVRRKEVKRLIQSGLSKDEANKRVPLDFGFFNKTRLDALDAKFKSNGLLNAEEAAEYNRLVDMESLPRTTGSVPAAPFVTKTEGWLNLALKRIMVMAAEGGYDKVAFVNGEQSADRYDLSKQVRSITGTVLDDGRLNVDVDFIGNEQGPTFIVNDENELAEKIGKDPAERLFKKFETAAEEGRQSLSQSIKGGDLKIGGEGMKAFYDQIVPTAVKKLLPKVGGGKMEMLSLQTRDSLRGREAYAYSLSSRLKNDGEWSYSVTKADEPDKVVAGPFESGEEARAWLYANDPALQTQQPGFTVTQEMREKAQEGIPQFALPRTVNVEGKERPTRISENAKAKIFSISGETIMENMGIPEDKQEEYWSNLSKEERDNLFYQYKNKISGAGKLIHPTIDGVKNFWRWFGNSRVVEDDGTPQIWYHGTARDIGKFEPKQAKAIFLTQDPEFAEGFASGSAKWMIRNATKFIDEKIVEQAIRRGISNAIAGGQVSRATAKDWLEYRDGWQTNELLTGALISNMGDYVSDEIEKELPSNQNIIPLFVRAEKPFDYDNEGHINDLISWAESLDKQNPARQFILDTMDEIENGAWDRIESPAVQSFLKERGYDAFFVSEGGQKNLAVYDPNQVKSSVGNTGAFSRDSGEIQYALPLTSTEKDEIVRRAKKDLNLAQQMLRFAKNMTPQEREKLGRANAVKMIDLLGRFPDANEYAAVAFAGRAKRGWYKQSAETLISVFGYDAPRFAGLLAALSPQCSVETNLTNALNLWKNWTAAGRPTNRKAILKIAGDSVQGDKGEESVLDSWKNNSERALTIENVNDLVLSGPKVNSFYQNLIGVTYEVTNDAWMANFAFLDQKLFSGSLTGKYDPGKRPGYLTQSVIVREAADILTKRTGREWTPAEVQETVWSWAKALYEGAEAEGIAPIQFLTEGKLTDELINAVPDFGTLFYSPEYESILREAGYGKQLDALIQQRDRTGEGLPDEKRVTEEEAEPFGPITQRKLVTSAAKRLGELKAFRDRQAEIERRLKNEAVVTFEIRPSETLTNLVPEIHDADPKMKKKFADGAYDILFNERGEDKLAMLLGHISKLRKIGSGGFEGKIHPNYQVAVPEEDANAYAAATGYVFLQDAVPWQKPKSDGWGFGIAISIKEEKGQPRRNIEAIERDFFDALDKLTGTGHTRNGKTFYVGNFTEGLDNGTFEYLVSQIVKDVSIKHKVALEVEGYQFDGNYLMNSVEGENGETLNGWKTEAGGAGYLQGDGGERLANLQNSLDAMQSEFIRYCEDFREAYLFPKQKVTKERKPKKDAGQYALPQNILGQRATAPSWTNPTDSKLDTTVYYLQDKMIDMKRVIQEIIKSAGNIADRWNPYLQEELYHGRTAQQTERFLRTELRPLLVDLNKNNISLAELEEYLHNRHAEERNDQIASVNPTLPDGGSGITTQQARNYLNAIPPARKRILDALAKKVDDINRGTRKILVDSGLEKAQTIASWEQTYPNYVPLFREDADYVTSSGYGVGQGFNIRGDFSKRATGSTRNVVDIMANVVMQRERAIIRAEKNRVAKALYGLAIQNPNQKFWMPIDPEAIKDPSKIRNEILAMGLNPNDLQNIFQQPTQPKVDPRTGLVTNKLDPFVLSSDNVLSVRIDGRNHYLLFNDNEPRSKRMITALKNLDADQLGRVMNFMGKISRWVSSINTQYNPIFGVVNLFRDVQGAALNLSTTPIADKVGEVMNLNNLKDAMGAIWSTTRAERSGSAAPNTQWAKLWRELQEEGGQTGYRSQFSSSQERADELQSELNKISEGKLKHAGRAMVDVLSDYNTTMENAVRLSAYKSALAKGLSKQQAASIAKNLTVNFNRKGQIATQAGALYSFFNASVQGTARLVETMRGPMAGKILMGGLLLGAVQAAMLAAAGFDDDEPPEFIKERNFVIPIGGKKYISIPLPLGYNIIPNTARHIAEIGISGGKHIGDHVVGITGAFIESFNPVGGAGWSLQTLFPTPVDPFIALAENKDSFGRPIYKENFSNLDPTPGYLRTKDSATAFSKGLSEFLNAASGGTKYKPGVVDVTPDQIDYLLGQAGGGVFRELQKTEQTIAGTIKGEEVAPYKMPLVGRFYGNAESNAAQAQRYYENVIRLNEHENEIKGRIKNREPIADYLRENPEARLFKMGNGIENNIRKLKQRRELLESRGASKEQIKQINDTIVKLMIRLNERMEKAEG